ncbi:MAG: tetratricopeptide repeat protein [Bacteroidota bacterium]
MKRAILLFIGVLYATSGHGQVSLSELLNADRLFVQGVTAFENEEYENAEELLLQAYEQLSEKAGVSYTLADLYLSIDNLPQAALFGKQAVAQDPDNKWYRIKLAEIYRSAGENQATLEELNSFLKQKPNDIDALIFLANTYKDYGQYNKSIEVLNRLLVLMGPNTSLYFLKIRNFEALGVQDSVLAGLEAVRSIDPDNLEMLNLLSAYYTISGNEDQAKSVLDDALSRNARDPQSLINLAGLYIDEEKWDSAGTLLGNFISDPLIEPEDKLGVVQYVYQRQIRTPNSYPLKVETARIMDLFAESEPEYGPAFTIAGQFYAQDGQNEEALDKLEQANRLLPDDDIAWRQRLQLLLAEGRYEEVIEIGRKADQNIPDDALIQFFLGSAYQLQSNYQQAETWFEKATRAPARKPFKSIVYSALADVQANMNKNEESDASYELALRFDPENDNAMNNYAYNLSLRGVELERAKTLALKAIEADPENASYLDTVGWVYYKLGDYDRARRFIKASIDTGESSAEVMEHLGDVYAELGNTKEARKWWKQALEKDSTRTYLKEKLDALE